ncbi:MAG: hypothetical protein IJP54_06125 [Synergistaceae bacterium]|nr:hypothetical protein [Synergistaceae bacterium]
MLLKEQVFSQQRALQRRSAERFSECGCFLSKAPDSYKRRKILGVRVFTQQSPRQPQAQKDFQSTGILSPKTYYRSS